MFPVTAAMLQRMSGRRKSAASTLFLIKDLGFDMNSVWSNKEIMEDRLATPINTAVEDLEPRDTE